MKETAPGVWEYRIFHALRLPALVADPPPTITVTTFTGTRKEFLTHLEERLHRAFGEQNAGNLFSIAIMLLREAEE